MGFFSSEKNISKVVNVSELGATTNVCATTKSLIHYAHYLYLHYYIDIVRVAEFSSVLESHYILCKLRSRARQILTAWINRFVSARVASARTSRTLNIYGAGTTSLLAGASIAVI